MKALIMIGLFAAQFGLAKHKIATGVTTTVDGVVSVSAEWVKDKGRKWDVELQLKSLHPKPFIILRKEIQCFRGEKEGSLRKGEEIIALTKNHSGSYTFQCDIGVEAKGDFKLVISKVYENPDDDGQTKGKVLANNVLWQTPDKKDD